MFPRSPRLVSFPCFSTAPSRFLSSFPRKLRGNHQFTGSEAGLGPKSANSRQNTGYFAGIPGKPQVYLENTWYFAGFLGFASDFAPEEHLESEDQLLDSGKLESCQNGAPNILWFPWKFPETKSAGDPLVSFLVSGNMGTGQLRDHPPVWLPPSSVQKRLGRCPGAEQRPPDLPARARFRRD